MKLAAFTPLLASCAMLNAHGFYIESVRPGPGALVTIRRCALDAEGRPTGFCIERTDGANSEGAMLARQAIASGPAIAPLVTAPLETAQREPDPPGHPGLHAALAVVNSGEMRARIHECRRQYATQKVPIVRFAVSITASGDVENVELHGDLESFFASCAAEALRRARFAPDVTPQHLELAIAL